MIFVDTSAWFAAFVPNDRHYADADAWLEQNAEPLVTTDYVLDELLTLLSCRGEHQRAAWLGDEILGERIAQFEWVTSADVDAAWNLFRGLHEPGWSFTDCTSRVVIERLSIATVFAFKEHFRQLENVTVVPGSEAAEE